MLDLQPQHQRNHLCSSSPTLKMHVRRKSTGDKELDFWTSPCKSLYYDNFSFDTEFMFQTESIGVLSPPLWKSYHSRSIHNESSPLLPCNHVYSNLSPISRRRAIVDGRRELMEMVENLPESSYELSLKDIVDAQNSDEKDEKSFVIKAETQITKRKKTNGNLKRGQITRTSSMESETFLIKMFFPASLGSKKKAKPGKSARLSSFKSPEQNEDCVEKVRWTRWFSVSGRSKSNCRSSNSESNRYGSERDFIPGCWSFFPSKKSKTVRDKRCLF